jgi:hypothetical protein
MNDNSIIIVKIQAQNIFFFLVKSQEFIATKVICYIHVFHSYKIINFMETKIFYKYRKSDVISVSY